MNIMVSACLLGHRCKYNGGDNYCEEARALTDSHNVIPVCPESAGGLPTPRPPCEIVDGEVMGRDGVSRDREFRAGAAQCLELAREKNIDLAVLQSRSPSCGVKSIYDGTFSGRLIEGMGVFAEMLKDSGFCVMDVEELKNDPGCVGKGGAAE